MKTELSHHLDVIAGGMVFDDLAVLQAKHVNVLHAHALAGGRDARQ